MPDETPAKPRIMLIHALADSVEPIHAAFRSGWQEAEIYDLVDTSLSADLAADDGVLGAGMIGRFEALARYAAQSGPKGRAADGILFTCSAFGPAIEAARRDLDLPVLKPNEAAFAEAIARGGRTAFLVTFPPALKMMVPEFEAMAAEADTGVTVEARLVEGALAALQAGRPQEHDRLVAEAAAGFDNVTTIVLGQFSMARAAPSVRERTNAKVLTTPDTAVAALRTLIEARG